MVKYAIIIRLKQQQYKEDIVRLEEFDPEHIITFKYNDIESMRRAMEEFSNLLDSDQAFKDDYCVAHFKMENHPVSESDFEAYPALITYLHEMAYYYKQNSEFDFTQMLTGEELFFLCALKHPELEVDILKTCEAIVRYAKKVKHSWELWITCETAFGIGPLQLVALQYPKYGYLMGEFLIVGWDVEHMPYHLSALHQWVSHVGICQDSIKAYCHCVSTTARQQMLGYDIVESLFLNDKAQASIDYTFDLLTYIRSSEEGYKLFVKNLAMACESGKGLGVMEALFCGDDQVNVKLQTLVAEMLIQHHPSTVYDYEYLSFDLFKDIIFIDTPASQAVQKLRQDLESELGGKIPMPEFNDFTQTSGMETNVDTQSSEYNLSDESVEDEDQAEPAEHIFAKGSLEEKLHKILNDLDREKFFRENELASLEILYKIVNDDRHEAYQVLKTWILGEHMEQSKDTLMGRSRSVSHRTYVLGAVYILHRDALNGYYDEVTELVQKSSEMYLPELILNILSLDGNWSDRYTYFKVKDTEPTNNYLINYKKETIEQFELWKPLETYLRTGRFNNKFGEFAFQDALNYYRDNLSTTYRNVAMKQKQFDIAHNLSHVFKLLYYSVSLEGTTYFNLCKRGLRLLLGLMPVYGLSQLEEIEPNLENSENLELQLAALQKFLPLGLSEQGYWAYQLEFWHGGFSRRELKEDSYAWALLDQVFQGHAVIEDSIHYASRQRVSELMISGVDALGMTHQAQSVINNYGVDYILRCIKRNFYVLTQYIDNLLKRSKHKFEELDLDLSDQNKNELLVQMRNFGAEEVSQDIFRDLSLYYKKEWTLRSCYLNKHQSGFDDIYNKALLNFVYTGLKTNQSSEVYNLKLILIDNWDPANMNTIQKLSKVDYKEFWLNDFVKMFTGELEFSQVEDLLKDAVKHGNFYGVADQYDVDIEFLMTYISSPIKERIEFVLKTVGEL